MRTKFFQPAQIATLCCTLLSLSLSGCRKPEGGIAAPPATPKQAASQIQQTFTAAPDEVKNTAIAASAALQSDSYEQAIQSLQTLRTSKKLTYEQGVAVHQSLITLEQKLLNGVASGDPNAKRAYELLQKSRTD